MLWLVLGIFIVIALPSLIALLVELTEALAALACRGGSIALVVVPLWLLVEAIKAGDGQGINEAVLWLIVGVGASWVTHSTANVIFDVLGLRDAK